MPKSPIDRFIDEYSKSLDDGDAALFVGAGFSRPAGFVDWSELLRDIAEELELDVSRETDLIAVAQYSYNRHGGRGHLNKRLIEEFTKHAEHSKNHDIVASLPIRTIWTTNYDNLIEESFRKAGKRPDVKIVPENMQVTLPQRDVTIYKMHGDISLSHEAVLTKDDYEIYDAKRRAFSIALQGDLIQKTFLFVGFSFTDPNIDYILSRIRGLLGENQRQHYCIMKWPDPPKDCSGAGQADYEYRRRRLEHRIEDLKRYRIQALMIEDFGKITEILRELNRRGNRKNVFVSGSAHDYAPLGRPRIDDLSRRLGKELITRGFNLISGFGVGIGGSTIIGAMEGVHADPQINPNERLMLRPFPQEFPPNISREEFYGQYRAQMISLARFAIFLCGNKFDPATNAVAPAKGVVEEFEIGNRFGVYPVPIGATGCVARDIWTQVVASLDRFFPNGGVVEHFDVLGDASRTNDDYIEAVFSVMKRVSGQ
jgi:hypothetical protein